MKRIKCQIKIKTQDNLPAGRQARHKTQAKKFWYLSFICGLWLAACSFTYLYAQDKIVAIVNNDIVTQKDLSDFVNLTRLQLGAEFKGEELENKIQSIKSDLLNKLIDDRIILQEAKKEKINIDQNRVKGRIDEIKKRYASDKEFQNALLEQGLVQADIETKIKEQILIYTIIEEKIKRSIIINPGDVTTYYEGNKENFVVPEQREFDSLGVEDEVMANDLFKKLNDGAVLEDLAKENSLEVNKFTAQGGGELRKEIEDVIFKLKLQEVSSPVKIENKYYIFKLNNIIPSRQQTLSESQDMIHAFLYNSKLQEKLIKWLDELKKSSYIKIMQ
jgi:parvulin-like peptidyl-prolyl isomerase